MELLKDSGRYVFRCEINERFTCKDVGFRWDGKKWSTDDPNTAVKLIRFASDNVKVELQAIVAKKEAIVEASRAVDADIDIPAPEGLEYMGFQKGGIAYALHRAGVLIGDEPGLGKTIQVAGIINARSDIKRVLVICPASLKINWFKELTKWLVRPTSIAIVDTKRYYPEEADIVIMNYDIVHKYAVTIREKAWDLLVCDEAHYLKNAKARRTQVILGKKKKGNWREWDMEPIPAKRRAYLTGTPICNRPIEIWPLIHSLDPNHWRSLSQFASDFCDAHHNGYGWDYGGACNLDRLQRELRETVMVRRLKTEVLKELPSKTRQVIEIPCNGTSSLVKREVKAYEKHQEVLAQLREAVELAKAAETHEEYAQAVRELKQGSDAAFADMAKIRQETAIAKIPYVLQHIEDMEGKKVVVFAHHKAVHKALKEALGDKAVMIVGDTPTAKRDEAVVRFQTDPSVTVFLGSIMAAGTGITLTASSQVVFAELDWVPGNCSQAEDRCHRIGQTEPVTVQHLVFEGSIDARMAEILVEKQKIIDKALDDPLAEMPALPDEPTTARVTRKQVEKEAPTLTQEQVEAIHAGLRQVSMYCDGAAKRDGMGFSLIDTRIGKSLALQDFLTPRQAVLGLRLVVKYARQIGADILAAAKGK